MENTIPFDTFSEMTKLTKLALGFNKISFLGKGAFFGLDSLHTLNLEYNRLTDLLGKSLDVWYMPNRYRSHTLITATNS